MAEDDLTRYFFSGFIRLHLLYHAAKEDIYGAEMAEELARHGYKVSQGTLYPVLHSLAEQGYLSCEVRLVDGRQRKYYRATEAGRTVLAEARGKLRELVGEILEDHDRLTEAAEKSPPPGSEGPANS
jgi:PadR family transcriptional regulator PadR